MLLKMCRWEMSTLVLVSLGMELFYLVCSSSLLFFMNFVLCATTLEQLRVPNIWRKKQLAKCSELWKWRHLCFLPIPSVTAYYSCMTFRGSNHVTVLPYASEHFLIKRDYQRKRSFHLRICIMVSVTFIIKCENHIKIMSSDFQVISAFLIIKLTIF